MSDSSSEHITRDREIPFISSAIKEISDKGKVDSPYLIDKVFVFFFLERDILSINDRNIDEIFSKIQESNVSFKLITNFIEYSIIIRPPQRDYLFSLLYKISKVTKYVSNFEFCQRYGDILIQRGIMEENIYDDYDDIYEEKRIMKAIREDSVEKLIEISAQHDFDPKATIKVDKYHSIFFVTEDIDLDENSKCDTEVTYMQIMAYFGSVKCFKWALIDGSFDESKLSKFAVAGGNNEIIHLLEQNGVSFDDCFETSVRFHRNNLSDWLLTNYECKSFELSHAVEYFNIPAFYFLLQNGISSSDISINYALISSAKTNFLSLISYLLDKGANIEAKDKSGKNPLHFAVKYSNLDAVRYLLDKGANIEARDNFGWSPLHFASKYASIDIIGYLLDKGANIEATNTNGYTPLIYGIRKGSFNAFGYLRNRGAKIDKTNNFSITLSMYSMYSDSHRKTKSWQKSCVPCFIYL